MTTFSTVCFAYFLLISLTQTEAARLSAVLKVEAVTELPVVKLDAVQTAKGRPQNGAEGLHLGEAAHEEINVAEVTGGKKRGEKMTNQISISEQICPINTIEKQNKKVLTGTPTAAP